MPLSMTESTKDTLSFIATLCVSALCGVLMAWRG